MKLGFMRMRTVVSLLAVAVLVSLGSATHMADAEFSSILNERIVVASNPLPVEHGGVDYYKEDNIFLRFTFDGDLTVPIPFHSIYFVDGTQTVTLSPTTSANITWIGGNYTNSDSFYLQWQIIDLPQGETTVTFPAGFVVEKDRRDFGNRELPYTFVYDSVKPILVKPASSTFTPGSDVPELQCTDTYDTVVTNNHPSETFGSDISYDIEYYCSDLAGNNALTKTVIFNVDPSTNDSPVFAEPKTVDYALGNTVPELQCKDSDDTTVTNNYFSDTFQTAGAILIKYTCTDHVNDPVSKSVYYNIGPTDTANPTFAADADFSTVILNVGDDSPLYLKVECVDPYRSYEFAYSTQSFNGDRVNNLIIDTDVLGETRISYSCTDTSNNRIDAVKIYRIFPATAPTVPNHIFISHDGDNIHANFGDIVTVTFDTLYGSTVVGTIDGKPAKFVYGGISSTLTRTLDGTETQGVLTFSFVQSNNIGFTTAQTAVRGVGSTYSVTADFAAPVFTTSTDTTAVTLGDTVPTLSALCTDANTITVTNDAGSATFDAEGAKTILYTCTDAAGNTATQSVSYSVAAPFIFNERASSPASKTEVDGTIYHNSSPVRVHFTFDGDGSSIPAPSVNTISVTGGIASFPFSVLGNGFFSYTFSVYANNNYNAVITVTYPANSFTINGVSNNAVTYAYVSDRTDPTFQSDADFGTVELTVGDDSPTLPTLQCRDPNISTASALRSGSVNANLAGDYPVEYTCTDKAGNSVTKTKTYRVLAASTASTVPAVPTNISIASDNARDTSLAKIGDIVTITFDTESGSAVTGTIDGKNATFAFNGTSSTLTRTLDGTETEGAPLAFSFVQSNSNGDAATQTAVRGAGLGSSVTANFAAPADRTALTTATFISIDPSDIGNPTNLKAVPKINMIDFAWNGAFNWDVDNYLLQYKNNTSFLNLSSINNANITSLTQTTFPSIYDIHTYRIQVDGQNTTSNISNEVKTSAFVSVGSFTPYITKTTFDLRGDRLYIILFQIFNGVAHSVGYTGQYTVSSLPSLTTLNGGTLSNVAVKPMYFQEPSGSSTTKCNPSTFTNVVSLNYARPSNTMPTDSFVITLEKVKYRLNENAIDGTPLPPDPRAWRGITHPAYLCELTGEKKDVTITLNRVIPRVCEIVPTTSIEFGDVPIGQTSSVQNLAFENTGNQPAAVYISGDEWKSNTDGTKVMDVSKTRHSSDQAIKVFDDRTELTIDRVKIWDAIDVGSTVNTALQLVVDLVDSTFRGEAQQTITTTVSCTS